MQLRTRGRKILRDVMARKGRTALVALAIFIGVTGTIALFSMSDIIVSQLREDVKEDELSMLDVYVTINTGVLPDNETYLEELSALPGVTDVQGFIQAAAQFKVNEEDEDFENGVVNAYSAPYEPRLPITPLRLLEGAYPSPDNNEVAIETRMAEEYGLSVGDTIYFRILSRSRTSENGEIGTVEPWTVTGIVFHPYTFTPMASVYTHPENANYISGTTGFGGFQARFTDYETAQAQKDAFADAVARETPYVPVFIQSEDPANNSIIMQAQTIAGTMGILALIALVVSGFLVINVITSIVVEQKRQIGVMKSMGATRWDNFFMYSGIAFVYGLIAVIPGVIVGIPLGNAAAHALAPQLNTVLEGFKTSPSSIILGVIVGLAIPVLASLVPVFNGTRVRILEAMTDLGIDANYGSGPLAKIIARLPLPITVRQGLSNVSLKKARLAFTVVTLAIAAGAFMGIYAMFNSLTTSLNYYLDSFNVQIGIFPNEGRDPDEFTAFLRENFQSEDNNVFRSIEPGFQLQVEFEGYDPEPTAGGPPGIFAYGYDVNSETPAFNFEITEGESLTEETATNGIILSSLISANMDKTVGDTVVMRVPGNTSELQVVGIAEFPLDQVWMDWRTLAQISGYVVGAPRPNEYFTTLAVEGFDGSMPQGQVGVVGFDETVAAFIPFDEGEFVTPGEPGIIISSGMAESGGYSVGDTLTVTGKNGTTAELPIVGIVTLPPMMQNDQIPPDFAGMFWQDLAALEGLSLEGKPQPQGYFITTHIENPTEEDLEPVIDEIDEVMLGAGIPVGIFNFVELVNQISEIFTTIQVILSAVALLIALVGALGLLTTLSMSVYERQKEIGVMRSIGAGSSTVALQFLTEGLVVGVIAWLVGLPLAAGVELLLLNVTGFNETFPFTFPVSAAVIGLVGMLVITTIASLWPSIAASRKTVSDILRYQ